MEDYHGAFRARKQDAVALLPLQGHNVAAFHLGGIAVECRLKALLLLYHRIQDWDRPSQRRKDAMFNQEVKNPGHSLMTALKRMPFLYKRAKLDHNFLKHLQKIIHPFGATSADYISIRYLPQATLRQNDWQQSFDYVCGWLKKNEGVAL
ncbi:MAG: hypothetical protein D3917_01855 [Candidatus Electrothrix sp. AX5]|nr:hypothetical protein [Candidatus Electrothrix sp. AX5]